MWAGCQVLLFVTLFLLVQTGFTKEHDYGLFGLLAFTFLIEFASLLCSHYKEGNFLFLSNCLISLGVIGMIKMYLQPLNVGDSVF